MQKIILMPKRARTGDYSQATEVYSQGSYTAGRRLRRASTSRTSLYRRMYRGMRLYRTPSNMVYPFERTTRIPIGINQLGGFLYGVGGGANISLSFSLSNTTIWWTTGVNEDVANPGSGDFQALFDQWRLNKVNVRLIWSKNVENSTNVTHVAPTFFVVTDYDDAGTFIKSDLLQYPNVRTLQLGHVNNFSNSHTVYNPSVNLDAQGDLLTALPSASRKSPWCDCAVPNVMHHGIKMAYENFDNTIDQSDGTLLLVITHHFEFRYAR